MVYHVMLQRQKSISKSCHIQKSQITQLGYHALAQEGWGKGCQRAPAFCHKKYLRLSSESLQVYFIFQMCKYLRCWLHSSAIWSTSLDRPGFAYIYPHIYTMAYIHASMHIYLSYMYSIMLLACIHIIIIFLACPSTECCRFHNMFPVISTLGWTPGHM